MDNYVGTMSGDSTLYGVLSSAGGGGGGFDFNMSERSRGVEVFSFAYQTDMKSFTCNNTDDISMQFDIKGSAFLGCSGLKTVRIERVNSIGGNAFSGCNSVTDYWFGGTFSGGVPALTVFSGMDISGAEGYKIHVPANLEDSWKADSNWASYADHIVGDYE